MADKSHSTPLDSFMKQYLQGLDESQKHTQLVEQAQANRAAQPGYTGREEIPTTHANAYDESAQAWADFQTGNSNRDLGEHLQDIGTGLMGTLGAIGGTADIAGNLIADSLANVGGAAVGLDATWDRTAGALDRMNSTRNYWQSLESEKSAAFDRVTAYRQQQAVDQANEEAFAATGDIAQPFDRILAEALSAGSSYLQNPGQIVTDSIAQLPYLLTGGLAKGVTEGTAVARPLIARLVAGGMTEESAVKLVQMGIVGGSQGTIEGADAASQAYASVMASDHTFGPGQEAERESAALAAAGKAFAISAPVSAITGTLASKFELEPFHALGRNAAARTGDNLVKALQEGIQETIESGNSQFASNYGANSVLGTGDQVMLDQGVGGAAGQGFVVGAGSTVTTNPRAALDAAITPLSLAGTGFAYAGNRAIAVERAGDAADAVQRAQRALPTAETPAAAAVLEASTQQTTDTPAEQVVLPPEIDTTDPVSVFATGMTYLQGKDMDSTDAVSAFHVLGSVLETANTIQNLRHGYEQDISNEATSETGREHARQALAEIDAMVDPEALAKWVDQLPMADIESELEDLRQNPENFGAVVAHLAAMSPLKMTPKVLEAALEATALPERQREALKLSQELLAAQNDLQVGTAPNSSEVSRSIMQTGFPKAGSKLLSIADMIRNVTSALDQGDQDIAQSHFNKLVSFSNYLTNRSGRFRQALRDMNASGERSIEVPGTKTWDKADQKLTDRPFVLHAGNEGSLAVVPAVERDAATVAKMVSAIQKRTGLVVGGAIHAAAQQDPTAVEAPESKQEAAPAKTEAKPAPKAEAAPAPAPAAPVANQNADDLVHLTDEQLGQEIDRMTTAIQRRRSNDTGRAVEQDIHYSNLVREQARRLQEAKPVDKPVEQVAETQSAPEPAPVEDAPVAVEPSPSRNHFTDLQPDYPATGGTVAEQNDAKNHLAQSFTTSDKPGLLSRLPETVAQLVGQLKLSGKNAEDAAGVFAFKDQLRQRLNEQLAKRFPKTRLAAMLKGQNFWKEPNAHSLYATRWDEHGIAYDPTIAEVMAWTGIQHLLDLVYPMSWSADKTAAFVITYGESILPLLAQGWVPLADQAYQVAQKLQTNLELTPDNTVSSEYTEGTMLALAMDTLGVMMEDHGYNGALQSQQIPTLAGPLVQWIKVGSNPDVLHDAARALEGFFPERSAVAAGVVATMPEKVNPLYRGSRQKVGKSQRQALLKMSQTAHKLSPLLLKLWQSLPNEAGLRLFGFKPVENPTSLAEIAQDGANKTLLGDLRTIGAHIRAVQDHVNSQEEPAELISIPSYFEYEMVVNGRAMTKGTSPQSSKLYRELFSTVQETVDPAQDNRGFLMAVAQGFGEKMDKQPVDTSLANLQKTLAKPEVQRALQAALRFSTGDVSQLDADLAAFEASGIEMTPHALSAMVHMAHYQQGQPFQSSLSYEIDGLTDGPINLMMLLGLQGDSRSMEHWLGLGGLWFDNAKVAVQDKLDTIKNWFGGSKDLYEIIADRASSLNNEQAQKILESVPEHQRGEMRKMLQAILHLMHITKLSQSNLEELAAKHSRSFTKKPTQAAGYQQGPKSIVNDLTNTLLEALSQRNDAGLMTDGDWRAVDMLLGNKIIFSKTKQQYFLKKDAAEFEDFEWQGQPLNGAQFKALTNTLLHFGGSGLANATMQTIGYQRMRMSDAVTLVNAHINYAQHVLRQAYAAKQAEEVGKGNLHPNQALSRQDEQALIKDVWNRLIPHPMLRNTGGLPVASTTRTGVPMQNVRRVQGLLFDRQNLQVSEASFEDPGVSFAALSIMAAGDGSMMTGFFANHAGNSLNMFDGVYLSPSEIDSVGEAINREVKRNWEHDYIGAVLDSLKLQDEGFNAWVMKQGSEFMAGIAEAEQNLKAQREIQKSVMADINSRPHSVSHMAGHNSPHYEPGTPLNSTTLGTSTTDPLLDLALDSLGQVANGVRKLGKSEALTLLKGHTFENPVLGGLWKVLAPLLSDDLNLYVSADRQTLAEFYQHNEDRTMGPAVDGTAVGDNVYVRAINAETIVHELLHHTTKALTATFFTKPASLTAAQRGAMQNLLALMDQFLDLDPDSLPEHQRALVEHVQAIMRGYHDRLDTNSALQEFLAYGLTNYHLQRTLGSTKSVIGQLLESVFNAVKKLFGFGDGTQSDSMLAQMFSNFATLTDGASKMVAPVSMEVALESVNPELARRYGDVLTRMEQRAATVARSLRAKNAGRTRMQELADTGLFPMTNEQQSAAEYVQAIFAAGLAFKPDVAAVLQRVVDALRESNVLDPAQQAFFFENTAGKFDRAADVLALALTNPDFADKLKQVKLPRQVIEKDTLDHTLDTATKALFDWLDTGLTIGKDATLSDALEVVAERLQKSLVQSVQRQQAKPNVYRQVTEKLSQGVQAIGEWAGKTVQDRQLQADTNQWINNGLNILAGSLNERYADMLGKTVLSLSNHMEGATPFREFIQELVGTVGDNFKLIQMKGIAARMISAIRQTFREQVPNTVKSWFTDLSEEQDNLLHKVIGQSALYTLSQGMKDRLAEILTDPTNAMMDAQLLLMGGGDRTKRALMVKYAKHMGDHMAGKGNQALYRNTRALAGLAVHGGGDVLNANEMAALEDLSTLQALSHLTPVERRMALDLLRNQPDGFWKTTALIHAYQQLDTQRAGQDTATLNFQKGWIPVEADGRKKVRLVKAAEVRKAERMGWVVVGKFEGAPAGDTNYDGSMVYMASRTAQTPTLSGGAIHSVDMHMNGIHYHSGLPVTPGVQTTITDPRYVAKIRQELINGAAWPYTALYDASGDVVGFQRLLDPAVVARHTRDVRRISDAAGIWMGRLHEERVAHGQNQKAAELLKETWDSAPPERKVEFVDIRSTNDKILNNVWQSLPYHTKRQLEDVFADGSQNPPIWIRRDQLNDAVGYHKASVSNFFTGDNRLNRVTNDQISALARETFGKNIYKYMVMAEDGWQGIVSSAKDTIIVKSLVVALGNLASNQTQMFMITGNPIWNARVQAQKHKEVMAYLGYQKRIAMLTAEGLVASPQRKVQIDDEQAQLKRAIQKLSIHPLIEAGEMPTIAEGLSETEEFSLAGDFVEWAEKQLGRLPKPVQTVIDNVIVAKHTSLYKGLDRLVQYGDFVAKAAMYEWMTTQDADAKKRALELVANDTSKQLTLPAALHQVALMEVNDEFVNYARLPGRMRTLGEDMGLTWFYNYKIRILKIIARRIRKNPAAFLIGASAGGMLGIDTLAGNLPWNVNLDYATGIDPLFSAHESLLWAQLL